MARTARFSRGDFHNSNVHVFTILCSTVVAPSLARILVVVSLVGYRRRGILGGRAAAGAHCRVVQGRTQVALLMVALRQGRLGVADEPFRCKVTIVVPVDTAEQ